MADPIDVLIVGGGPVGAGVAALLAGAGNRAGKPFAVTVLEPNRPSFPQASAPVDLRVFALSRASERMIDSVGAWSRIATQRASPYERMRVWHESFAPRSAQALVFDAAEAGEPNLGHIVENRLLQAALLEAAEKAGVNVASGELKSLRVADEYVEVDTTTTNFSARLVVGADGANSAVRSALGLTVDIASFRQSAIVANVATELPHENTAWQRFLSTGTLAFLPLVDGTSSIVWSVDDDLAPSLQAMAAADFSSALTEASGFALGTARLVSDRLSFPLRNLAAQRFVAHRCALVGDAAHVVHPLAGQGINLGFLDAAALVKLLVEARREREDPGALRVLRRYERWRKSETEIMRTAIEAFNRFLAHGSGPFSRLAQQGLGWVNRSEEAKRFFIRHALGSDLGAR
jgi:2-polyprenylphenol 6-hydroxylase